MAFTEKEINKALKLYKKTGSITKVIQKLGYPSRQNMYTWIKNNKNKPHKTRNFSRKNKPHPTFEEKIEVLNRCFLMGEDVKLVSEETGYSRTSIYQWRKIYIKRGKSGLMTKNIKRGSLNENKPTNENDSKLQEKILDLQLENDILKETIEILKKDQSIDQIHLKNKEKTMIIDALRKKYSLSLLIKKLNIAKSSYCYQHKALHTNSKYDYIKERIITVFKENQERYGYRRIHSELRKINIIISEKVVRKLMKECNLIIKITKTRKYNSYKGEISEPVPNILNRDFHATMPNLKMLTDITEFSIPAGKLYFSPLIDCFDGKISSWAISVKPDSKLVNSMLDKYALTVSETDKPIIHTDRGCHYRWNGWIDRMERYGFIRSMSKKGCSPDNSACEGFFGRMKNEMFYNRNWNNITLKQFKDYVKQYVTWYNEKRIKQSLNYMSPMEYRQRLGFV